MVPEPERKRNLRCRNVAILSLLRWSYSWMINNMKILAYVCDKMVHKRKSASLNESLDYKVWKWVKWPLPIAARWNRFLRLFFFNFYFWYRIARAFDKLFGRNLKNFKAEKLCTFSEAVRSNTSNFNNNLKSSTSAWWICVKAQKAPKSAIEFYVIV